MAAIASFISQDGGLAFSDTVVKFQKRTGEAKFIPVGEVASIGVRKPQQDADGFIRIQLFDGKRYRLFFAEDQLKEAVQFKKQFDAAFPEPREAAPAPAEAPAPAQAVPAAAPASMPEEPAEEEAPVPDDAPPEPEEPAPIRSRRRGPEGRKSGRAPKEKKGTNVGILLLILGLVLLVLAGAAALLIPRLRSGSSTPVVNEPPTPVDDASARQAIVWVLPEESV